MSDLMHDDIPGGREPARRSSRVSERGYVPPEPHQKYDLMPHEIPAGMDAQWLPTKIVGMPNREVMTSYKAGWRPARASDVPRVSGYGTDFPQELIDAQLIQQVSAESPIVIDDLMLVFRPKELSERANKEREQQANSQVKTQFARLQQAYRHRGGNLGIERRAGPPPRGAMTAQQDDSVDEE